MKTATKKPAAKATKPKPVAPDIEELNKQHAEQKKRLAAIEKLGTAIADQKRVIGKQETVVAEAKSKLDDVRSTLHEEEHELEEMQKELDTLAIGGFSERLPLQKAAPTTPASGTSPMAVPDSVWRPVTLEQLGIKGKAKDTLEADGIKTHGDLADAFRSHKILDIKGIGDEGRSKLNEAMAQWWEKNRLPVQSTAPVDSTSPEGNDIDDAAAQAIHLAFGHISLWVVRRGSGKWAMRFDAQAGLHDIHMAWLGSFPSRYDGLAAAIEGAADCMKSIRKHLDPDKSTAVFEAINAFDRKLLADLKASGDYVGDLSLPPATANKIKAEGIESIPMLIKRAGLDCTGLKEPSGISVLDPDEVIAVREQIADYIARRQGASDVAITSKLAGKKQDAA